MRGHPELLAYGLEQGDGYFRQALADFLTAEYAAPVQAEELFVTAGASQALDMVCTLFARPGDTVLVEDPSYFLALRIFADHQLNVIGIPIDENGLIIPALEEVLKKYRPAFIYTIPAFHNPGGCVLSAGRRQALIRLSSEQNILLVADEVYQLLNYDANIPAPLAQISLRRLDATRIKPRSYRWAHSPKLWRRVCAWVGFRQVRSSWSVSPAAAFWTAVAA
jgi:DNA-binding transcriptional MocR family regulator